MRNKTAMQELIYWLKSGWKDEDIDTVLKKAEQLLEVEKEQIIDARANGFMSSAEGWNGEIPCMKWSELVRETKCEEYYNETYDN